MNRRAFFGLLGAGAAGFVIDPERLLWRPGAKTFFLPSVRSAYWPPGLVTGPVITAMAADGQWVEIGYIHDIEVGTLTNVAEAHLELFGLRRSDPLTFAVDWRPNS